MPLESATYIDGLNSANPTGADDAKEGDDHLRLVKAVLKATFPNISAAVNGSATQLNTLVSNIGNYILRNGSVAMTGALAMGSNKITGLANGTAATDAATKGQLDSAITALSSDTAVVAKAYPVGSIYINASDATSPATLLGFGTWSKVARGRCLFGEGSTSDGTVSRTFNAGTSGGKHEVALTEAQLPSHDHKLFANEVATSRPSPGGADAVAVSGFGTGNSDYQLQDAVSGTPNVGQSESVGAGDRHENTPAYMVVHIWQRTA